MTGSTRTTAIIVTVVATSGLALLGLSHSASATTDVSPAEPVMIAPLVDVMTSAESLVVEGTGVPGDFIDVTVGQDTVCADVVVAASGSWFCTADLRPLGDFSHRALSATQHDAALNESDPSVPVSVTRDTTPPSAPVLDEPVTSSPAGPATVTFTGSAADATRVDVLEGASVLCDAVPAEPSGAWTCAAVVAADGVHSFAARAVDALGNTSGPSATRTLTLSPPAIGGSGGVPLPPPPADPAPPAPAVVPDESAPGSSVVPAPGASDPTAASSESFASGGGTEGADIAAGVAGCGACPSGLVRPGALDAGLGANESSASGYGAPDAPSSVSARVTASGPAPERTEFGSALRTLGDLLRADPLALGLAAGAAVLFFFLLAVPSALLESTLEENAERLPRWLRVWTRTASGRGHTSAAAPADANATRLRAPRFWITAVGLVAAASVLSGFVDSSLAWAPDGLRLVLSLFVALVLLNAGSLLAVWLGAGRTGRRSLTITLRPATLILLAGTVVLSRLLELQPGVLFGLLIGVGLGAELSRRRQARIALALSAMAVGLGIAGWLGYSATAASGDFGPALLRDVSTGVVVEALTSVVVSLLPLAFLDGRAIWSWSRRAWALAYAIAAAAFGVILLPIPDSWVTVVDLGAPWVIASAAYAALSVAVWVWFRLRARPVQRDAAASDVVARAT